LTAEGHAFAVMSLTSPPPARMAFSAGAEFRAVLGGEEPKAYRLSTALAAVGAAPSEAVLLGDSRQDLLAAQAVGMRFVLVTGHGFFPPAAVLDGADVHSCLVAAGLDPDGLLTGAVAYQDPGGR
jgi:phosphoglycolate phosphatase